MLKSPVDYRWTTGTEHFNLGLAPGDRSAVFEINGQKYAVCFNIGFSKTIVYFGLIKYHLVVSPTGTGNAFQVYSTVFRIIMDYISMYGEVQFDASHPSQDRLYHKMAKRFPNVEIRPGYYIIHPVD